MNRLEHITALMDHRRWERGLQLQRELSEEGRGPRRPQLQRELYKVNTAIGKAWDELRAARAAAAAAWAELNGWRRTDGWFTVRALRDYKVHSRICRYNGLVGDFKIGLKFPEPSPEPDLDWSEVLDHVEYFRETTPPYRAAAIVGHPYPTSATIEDIEAWAKSLGLRLHTPRHLKGSWYYPDSTLMLCFTRRAIESVRWLPGQMVVPEAVA